MAKRYYVYTHSRRDTGAAFYVGCATFQSLKRGKHRYQRAYDFGQHTDSWKDEAANGVDVLIVYETNDRDEAFALERDLVELYGRKINGSGCLTNQCAGGYGAPEQPSSEFSRAKKARTKLGALNPMYGKTGALHPNSRKVRDRSTGTLYDSVQIAADALGHKMKTLYNWLSGHRPNPTPLEFA